MSSSTRVLSIRLSNLALASALKYLTKKGVNPSSLSSIVRIMVDSTVESLPVDCKVRSQGEAATIINSFLESGNEAKTLVIPVTLSFDSEQSQSATGEELKGFFDNLGKEEKQYE